jgi:hypothetical protein
MIERVGKKPGCVGGVQIQQHIEGNIGKKHHAISSFLMTKESVICVTSGYHKSWAN